MWNLNQTILMIKGEKALAMSTKNMDTRTYSARIAVMTDKLMASAIRNSTRRRSEKLILAEKLKTKLWQLSFVECHGQYVRLQGKQLHAYVSELRAAFETVKAGITLSEKRRFLRDLGRISALAGYQSADMNVLNWEIMEAPHLIDCEL